MDGGLNFGGYKAGRYLDDVKGLRRMAGDVFQPVFGDVGWNEDFVNMHNTPLEVERDPALDLVAAKAREKEMEEKMKG